MTKAEERRAMLQNKNLNTNINTSNTNIVNKAEERRKMLSITQPNIETGQSMQRTVNPAANILQNATKIQSYNDVVPQQERPQFKNTSFIDTTTMEQKPQTTEWNESTRHALDREGSVLGKAIAKGIILGADTVKTIGYNAVAGMANVIDAGYAGGTKVAGLDASTINAKNLIDYNNGARQPAKNMALLNPINLIRSNITGAGQTVNKSYEKLKTIHELHPNNTQLNNLYTQITNGTYKGTQEELEKTLSDIQTQIAIEFKAKHTDDDRARVAELAQSNKEKYGVIGDVILNKGIGTASQMTPTILASTAFGPAVGTTAIGLQAGGNAYNQALEEGANFNEAVNYGVLSGVAEATIEKIGGDAVNKFLFGGKGKTLTGGWVDDFIKSKGINNTFTKVALTTVNDIGGEAVEEGISAAVEPLIAEITYNPDREFNLKEYGSSIVTAMIESIPATLFMGGAGKVQTINAVNKYETGLINEINKSTLTDAQKAELIKGVQEKCADARIGLETNFEEIQAEVAENLQNATQTENISQNNVENAQNMQESVQNNVNPYNGYTNKEIENFAGGKIKVAQSDSDIINFAQTAKKVANNLKLYMSKVKKKTSDIIKSKFNINVEGYNISLKNDDVRKVYKDHGKAETEIPRGQLPITEEDFALIPTIINEADNIELAGLSPQGKPAIRFEKNINGNKVAVTYVSDKHKNLELQTMYKFKNDKKIDSSTALYENETPRLNTSEMDSSTNLINNIIPNSKNYVNNLLPTTEQLQAQDQKQAEEAYNTLNMKKPKLEQIAELTEEQATLPKMTYKQRADRNTPYRRKFWDNIESSKIVSKDVKEQVNMTNYQRKHNADVLEKMQDRLDTEPMRVAQEWFNKDIKKATEQDIALGAILLERYQAEGRIEEAVDVVEKLADMGTEAGRTVQMYSIFQRLTPEGMMMYQQRKLNSALETLTAKQTGKWVEQNKDKFKLTEDDATFITAKVQEAQNAPTERQKQIALAEIETRINDKLPPEAGQSVKAFRRIAMLFNPKTQVRNMFGNITVMPLNYVTDLVATGIDKAVAKKTGVRTTALPNVKTIVQGAKKGWNETWDDYKRGIRTTPTGSKYEIQNNVKSFNENTNSKIKNAINRKLNGIDRILSSVMEGGDRPFYEASYQNALEGQMKANNVTEPTQDMIDIASNVALSQTWQDSNNYTQAVLGIRNAFNKININGFGLGDLIIPFAKTPANLTKAMIDYSPAGLIPSIINYNDMRKAISRGDMTPMQQKKFVTSVGKAMAGTLLYALAYGLVQGGYITGSADEDKDVANFEKNVLGIQPYSIKIGDKTFTYNWAQPLATPFAIMADAKKMSAEDAKWNEILVNSFKVAGDQLVANSFLQGVQELLSSEYGNESAMDNLVGAIMDLPTQFTPTLFGQIATQFDKTKRQTFESGDSVGTMINEVKNKIPGARNTLAPQVNTFGEEIQNYGGANNPFNVFLSPWNESSTNSTDTQKELYALYEVTKDKTIFPRQAPYTVEGGGESFKLSSQDRADYQKISGQYVTEQLDALFDSRFYQSLENDEKADVVAKIVEDADLIAKDKWIDTKSTERIAEIQTELKESDIPIIAYYNAWASIQGIEGTKNWKGETISGSKKKNQITEINKAVGNDLTAKQKETLYGILNISGY